MERPQKMEIRWAGEGEIEIKVWKADVREGPGLVT